MGCAVLYRSSCDVEQDRATGLSLPPVDCAVVLPPLPELLGSIVAETTQDRKWVGGDMRSGTALTVVGVDPVSVDIAEEPGKLFRPDVAYAPPAKLQAFTNYAHEFVGGQAFAG